MSQGARVACMAGAAVSFIVICVVLMVHAGPDPHVHPITREKWIWAVCMFVVAIAATVSRVIVWGRARNRPDYYETSEPHGIWWNRER